MVWLIKTEIFSPRKKKYKEKYFFFFEILRLNYKKSTFFEILRLNYNGSEAKMSLNHTSDSEMFLWKGYVALLRLRKSYC